MATITTAFTRVAERFVLSEANKQEIDLILNLLRLALKVQQ